MFRRNPFLGSGLAMIAAAMTSAFHSLRPENAALPPPKLSKNAMKRHHRRISSASPNTTHGAVHNGTAFVYNQERSAARRVRQHEARFQKALDRLGPVESAAEFG